MDGRSAKDLTRGQMELDLERLSRALSAAERELARVLERRAETEKELVQARLDFVAVLREGDLVRQKIETIFVDIEHSEKRLAELDESVAQRSQAVDALLASVESETLKRDALSSQTATLLAELETHRKLRDDAV